MSSDESTDKQALSCLMTVIHKHEQPLITGNLPTNHIIFLGFAELCIKITVSLADVNMVHCIWYMDSGSWKICSIVGLHENSLSIWSRR